MSLTNPKDVVTEERLSEFYQAILPYLGGMPDVLANKFAKGDMFSTSEKMIGQWTDGKPLYQKVVTGLSYGENENTWKNTGANISDIDALIRCSGVRISDYTIANQFNFKVGSSNGNIQYFTTKSFGNVDCLIIQYTKTTDSAVAIGDDTDYSTTEKIVGTWIDGSPIYQKTIDFGALPNNTTKNVAHGISDISTVINITGYSKNTSNKCRNLPFVLESTNVSGQCRLEADTTNVIITTSGNLTSWTETYVTMQYTKSASE